MTLGLLCVIMALSTYKVTYVGRRETLEIQDRFPCHRRDDYRFKSSTRLQGQTVFFFKLIKNMTLAYERRSK